MDTIAIQEGFRETIARNAMSAHYALASFKAEPKWEDASTHAQHLWLMIADRILAIPEIEAGLGLYLASIETRDPA